MKKTFLLSGCIITMLLIRVQPAKAQAQEIAQLLLNVEKLAQFKQILNDMKTGYQIVSSGYNTVKNISQGNFNLHETFLNGLLAVSPSVAKYKRVADIISCESSLVKEYKAAFNRFKSSGSFNATEISYMGDVYTNLFDRSVENLDELTMIVTANKLRMSDDERLKGIDRIYADMSDKLTFLRSFNNSASLLAVQRAREHHDNSVMQQLYNVTP